MINKKKAFMLVAFGVTALTASAYDMLSYWVTAPGTVVTMNSQIGTGPIQANTHAFWQGWKWGKYVYVKGGSQMQDGDIYYVSGTDIVGIGPFRGNSQIAADTAFFLNPAALFRMTMNLGDWVEATYNYVEVDPTNRKYTTGVLSQTSRTEIVSYYSTSNPYQVPETGAWYGDVIYFKFWSNKNNPNSLEEYWVQKDIGQIRILETNGSKKSWITGVSTGQTVPEVQNPFVAPFPAPVGFSGYYHTLVVNGTFENYHSANGMALTGSNGTAANWGGTSADCVVTSDGSAPPVGYLSLDEAGQWKACLRGSLGGGDSSADAIKTTNWIPVTPGATYRLSGWIYRESSSDGAYLDFDDGNGVTSSGAATTFSDQHAGSTVDNVWEKVSTTITIPAWVNGVKIRCVRDGANLRNAYFDDIRLQLVPSGT